MASNNRLEYFKKKILAILDEKESEGAEAEPAVKKALDQMDEISKSFFFETMGSVEKSRKYGVGTIRVWRGKKYKKVSENPTRWVRYYDKVDRGAKSSMTRLKNKVKACQDINELYQFCMSNHALFKDANGVDLPIMDELRAEVDKRHTELENGTPATKPAEAKKEPGKTEEKKPSEIKPNNGLSEKDSIAEEINEYIKGQTQKQLATKLGDSEHWEENEVKGFKNYLKENLKLNSYTNSADMWDELNEQSKKLAVEYHAKYVKEHTPAKADEKKPAKNPNYEVEKQSVMDKLDSVLYTRNGVYGGESTYKELEKDDNKVVDYLKKNKPETLRKLENIAQVEKKSVKDLLKESFDRAVEESQKNYINDKYGDSTRSDVLTAIRDTEESLKLAEKSKDELKVIRYKNQIKALNNLNQIKYDAEEKEASESEEVDGYKVGDTVNHNGEKWTITKFFTEAGRKMVALSAGGIGGHHEITVDKMKDEQKESEAEKTQNRSDAMKGNQNAYKGGPKEEPKEAKTAKADVEQAKADMKKYEELFDKYANDWDHGVRYKFAKGIAEKDPRYKAIYRADGFENIEKMRNECEKLGIKIPEVPADLLKKYEDYKVENEKIEANGKPRYETYEERKKADKILSSIPGQKLLDLANACLKPIKEAYQQAKDKLPKEKELTPADNPPVEGLSNEEHAKLFSHEKDADGNEWLYYNGKPYGKNQLYDSYSSQKNYAETVEMVKNAGMDPKAQIDYVKDKAQQKAKEYYNDWHFSYSYGKYGEKKLKEIIKDLNESALSDSELDEKMLKACTEKQRDYDFIEKSYENHYHNQRVKEYCEKRLAELTASNEAINGVDLPVDPKDAEEAEKIIGSDVYTVLNADWNVSRKNASQTLKDKIERRVRNNPAVARAMLVYIKNEQQRTGKVVFQPKNEIWKLLPKLNENAMNAVMEGKEETDKSSDGAELYTGDNVSSVVENKELGRYQVFFNGKPDADVRNTLKRNGFRWAPSSGAWQCYNTANGERSLAYVAEKLGWKKN